MLSHQNGWQLSAATMADDVGDFGLGLLEPLSCIVDATLTIVLNPRTSDALSIIAESWSPI